MPLFATILAVSLVSLYTAGFATILICDDNDKQASKPDETEELLGEREDEKDEFLEKRKEDADPEVLRTPLTRALPTAAGSSAQAR